MSKRELVKRLDKIVGRVRVNHAGVVPIVDATKWQAEDRFAFARATKCGDQVTCDVLIEKHFGKLAERINDEVVAIVICG